MADTTINEVLLDLQRESKNIAKTGKNPAFKGSRYVKLEDLLETLTPMLSERDVLLLQPLDISEQGELVVKTILEHVPTGTRATSVMPLNKLAKQDPQGQGSAITYGRRYSLMSLLGLVGEEDDDGAAASSNKRATRPVSRKPSSAEEGW